jgi:hypothetical protein
MRTQTVTGQASVAAEPSAPKRGGKTVSKDPVVVATNGKAPKKPTAERAARTHRAGSDAFVEEDESASGPRRSQRRATLPRTAKVITNRELLRVAAEENEGDSDVDEAEKSVKTEKSKTKGAKAEKATVGKEKAQAGSPTILESLRQQHGNGVASNGGLVSSLTHVSEKVEPSQEAASGTGELPKSEQVQNLSTLSVDVVEAEKVARPRCTRRAVALVASVVVTVAAAVAFRIFSCENPYSLTIKC